METYDFGQRSVEPKEELNTPFEAMRAYHDLQEQVKRLEEYSRINGRDDHFIKNLDTLMSSCQDILYRAMVIREAITGSKWRKTNER